MQASAAGRRAGPFATASIHPYSLHASFPRTDHIGMGFVAYKQYFRGFQCQRVGERAVSAQRPAWRIRVRRRAA